MYYTQLLWQNLTMREERKWHQGTKRHKGVENLESRAKKTELTFSCGTMPIGLLYQGYKNGIMFLDNL